MSSISKPMERLRLGEEQPMSLSQDFASGDFHGPPIEKLSNIMFSSELEKERYTCVKCKHILKAPVRQTKCGHRLCFRCLQTLLQSGENMRCPGGEDDCVSLDASNSHVPDNGIVREMMKLPVKCENENHGCHGKVILKDIVKHEENCLYKLVECPNKSKGCSEHVPRCKLDEHLERCKIASCRLCKTSMLQCQLKEHEKNCEKNPHPCEFSELGCDGKGTEDDLQKHSKSKVQQHLSMLLNQVMTMMTVLRTVKEEVEQKQKEASVSEEQVKVLDEKVTGATKKYQEVQKQIAAQNQTVLQLKEDTDVKVANMQKQLEELKKTSGQSFRTDVSANVNEELARIQNFLAAQEIQFREFDLRFQCLETASFDGVLIWKIRDYRRRKQEAVQGRILSLYSQPFYTSKFGYKMCARVYLNGDGMGKNTHLSLFFVIMKGDYDALLQWPFKNKVTLTLLDQVNGTSGVSLSDTFRPDPTSSSFKRPTTEMNIASGCPLFVAQNILEQPPYMVEDTIYIKVSVDGNDIKLP